MQVLGYVNLDERRDGEQENTNFNQTASNSYHTDILPAQMHVHCSFLARLFALTRINERIYSCLGHHPCSGTGRHLYIYMIRPK